MVCATRCWNGSMPWSAANADSWRVGHCPDRGLIQIARLTWQWELQGYGGIMSKPKQPPQPATSFASRPAHLGASPILWRGWLAGALVSVCLWGGIGLIITTW